MGTVLAAALAAIGGFGAGFATGWFQRESARIAARAEHRRERRQQRHDSYKEFMTISTDMVALSYGQMRTQALGRDIETAPLNEAAALLQAALIEVSLSGPQKVAQRAQDVCDTMHGLMASFAMFSEFTEALVST
ncbi:hypothetical protein, partial [Streptomyces buecherae]